MEGILWFGICWLIILDPGHVTARAPNTKAGLGEEVVHVTPKPPPLPTELPQAVAERCRGYFDVMGQWDPPFNCNASSYLYCCGTCGYRFCCQFKHGRLDQSTCSNYDTPNWATKEKTPARGEDSSDDPNKDKTNMIVYIICGVAALMVLVGIFTKLAVEKTQRPPTDMNVSRTLTDLLKQPVDVELLNDGHRGSVQVQITDVIPRVSPRNSIGSRWKKISAWRLMILAVVTKIQRSSHRMAEEYLRSFSVGNVFRDHTNFNNMALNSPLVPQIGLSFAHNNRTLVPGIPMQDQEFSTYATLKAVDKGTDDFYKRLPGVDVAGTSPCYQPGILHNQDGSSLPDSSSHILPKSNHKVKVTKTNTHPLAGAGVQGWDPSNHDIRRQVYANKRQFSIEKLPELFSQQGHYTKTPQRHFSGNSKTEVTV